MGGDLVRDDPVLDIIPVGQAEVLLGRHVAEESSPQLGDACRPNGGGDVVIARRNVQREGPQGVEGRLVAPLELVGHVLGYLVHWDVAWPLVHDLDILLPGSGRELALDRELSKLGVVVRISDTAWPEPIPDRDRDVVLPADVKDVIPVLVRKVLLVVHQRKFGVDRSPPRHDSSHPVRGVGYEAKQDPGVDGEVVHALFSLLDEGLPEELPGDFHGVTSSFLEGLVDGDRAHRNRRVPHDPLPRLVDVLPRREVHEGVRPPHGRPLKLLDLLLDRAADRRVPNVRVDLDFELPANDHGLQLQVLLVARNDGPPPRDLTPDELGVHALPRGNVSHLLGDDALLGVVHLREALVAPLLPLPDPVSADGVQAVHRADVLRAGRVVDVKVRPGRALRQVDAAERDLHDLPVVLDRFEDLFGVGKALLEWWDASEGLLTHLLARRRRSGGLPAAVRDPRHHPPPPRPQLRAAPRGSRALAKPPQPRRRRRRTSHDVRRARHRSRRLHPLRPLVVLVAVVPLPNTCSLPRNALP
mmetsp:Transcript_3584/g.10121  ORF Transcript_3584/g.10121 Transcript_3584/m.10121 type:complete len:529 (-) Transcript_3584:53-1639(-)